ncbi:hypothetical protein HY212_01165 [Candidatus Pacearchaeota archaeon]|nr:hypothetical protein [Candidatus Pacearchaeota archaeon]
MKLRAIVGLVILSGASFVAGHDYSFVSKIYNNESAIKKYFDSIKDDVTIVQARKNLNNSYDLNPEIRHLQKENQQLRDNTWAYRIID